MSFLDRSCSCVRSSWLQHQFRWKLVYLRICILYNIQSTEPIIPAHPYLTAVHVCGIHVHVTHAMCIVRISDRIDSWAVERKDTERATDSYWVIYYCKFHLDCLYCFCISTRFVLIFFLLVKIDTIFADTYLTMNYFSILIWYYLQTISHD